MIVISESAKFAFSMALFLRSVFKAAVSYVNENKATPVHKVKGIGLKDKLPEDLPTAVDIKKALPRHCFQPKVSTSMYYAVRDAVFVLTCYYIFYFLHVLFPTPAVFWPTMFLYWAIQGTFLTAVFVVGHDCGHGSFSNHSWLNDLVGNVMHSFLLCPYYMWKLSHRHHHKFNANFEKDEVFYPVKKSEPTSSSFVLPGFGFGVGWFGYLIRGYQPRPVNHFNVNHSMFTGHVAKCSVSLACWIGMAYLLYLYYLSHGFLALFCYYVVPDFVFACYMVIITFLHHTETGIPWYADEKWDFVRGQLSTIDRNYGAVHSIIHCIGTHQMHHMFTKIPHYHLEEATVHFRKAFPQLVKSCDEPILPSFVRMFHKYDHQKAIEDDTKIHYYK